MISPKSLTQTEPHFETTPHPSHVRFDRGKELRRNIPRQHCADTRWACGDRLFTPKAHAVSTAIGVDELHQIRGMRCIERRSKVRRNGLHKRKTTMKNNYVFQAAYASEPAKESAVGRVQVYRESRGGNSIPCFGTDSDTEAAWPEISLPVLLCVNLFQDCFFALIACDLSGQKEISGEVEMCL